MDLEKANSAAEAMLSQERARSEPLARAGATTRRYMDRFRVGVMTLVGAYAGFRIAEKAFGPDEVSIALGLALGLLVAVTFPRREG